MTAVAVIGSNRCCEEFLRTVSDHGVTTVIADRVFLGDLPQVIDDFRGLLPESVFSADVVLDFSGHPDIPYALKSAKKIITTSKCILPNVVSTDCFCGVDICEEFGIPEFKILCEKGRIKKIQVIKSSPCGAAYYLVDKLRGLTLEEAVNSCGLLTQFICKGRGGPHRSIHKAAEIHRAAIERAVL